LGAGRIARGALAVRMRTPVVRIRRDLIMGLLLVSSDLEPVYILSEKRAAFNVFSFNYFL
jgi:hypothetical protein